MPEQEITVEEKARIMGHVSKEEFKGDPDKWVPADQWVERAEKILPINRAMVDKLTKDISELKTISTAKETALVQEIASLKKTFGEYVEFSKKAEERAFKKALAELEGRQRQAVEDGDVEAFDRVKTELDELKTHPALTGAAPVVTDTGVETKPAATAKTWPEVSDPTIYQEWAAENEWMSDIDMAIYARDVDMHLGNTIQLPTQREQLDKITEYVKKKFPQYWENQSKGKPQTVEGSTDAGTPSGNNRKKTYNDLTAEEKRYCDEWTGKDGKGTGSAPGLTRDEWIKQYFMGK
jgi:hypothetical protein